MPGIGAFCTVLPKSLMLKTGGLRPPLQPGFLHNLDAFPLQEQLTVLFHAGRILRQKSAVARISLLKHVSRFYLCYSLSKVFLVSLRGSSSH